MHIVHDIISTVFAKIDIIIVSHQSIKMNEKQCMRTLNHSWAIIGLLSIVFKDHEIICSAKINDTDMNSWVLVFGLSTLILYLQNLHMLYEVDNNRTILRLFFSQKIVRCAHLVIQIYLYIRLLRNGVDIASEAYDTCEILGRTFYIQIIDLFGIFFMLVAIPLLIAMDGFCADQKVRDIKKDIIEQV